MHKQLNRRDSQENLAQGHFDWDDYESLGPEPQRDDFVSDEEFKVVDDNYNSALFGRRTYIFRRFMLDVIEDYIESQDGLTYPTLFEELKFFSTYMRKAQSTDFWQLNDGIPCHDRDANLLDCDHCDDTCPCIVCK